MIGAVEETMCLESILKQPTSINSEETTFNANKSMVMVICYQLFIALITILFLPIINALGLYSSEVFNIVMIQCILCSTISGVLYCLRAIYKNRCVRNIWTEQWVTWYYLRPITSCIAGFLSYIAIGALFTVISFFSTDDLLPIDSNVKLRMLFMLGSFFIGYNVKTIAKFLELE